MCIHTLFSRTPERPTRGANTARGSASECRGSSPENPGSAGTGCLVEAARATSIARVTHLPVGLRIAVLLALVLIATITPARADTLDVRVYNTLYTYEGTVLVVDQVGQGAIVGFDAQSENVSVRTFAPLKRWPLRWDVVVGSNNGVQPREWIGCYPISLVYAESSGMHITLECTR
jgi:hypothetical protein